MKNLYDLQGKTAVITGGSGVLGSAIAAGLVQAGARVAVLGRSPEKVAHTVRSLRDGSALALTADVVEKEQLLAARQALIDAWGAADILINCAGGNQAGATILPSQSLFDLSIDAFDQVAALNLKGTLLPILTFGETMADRRSGCIINISSVAAQRPLTRVLGYAAAKAAVENLTRWLAVEMAAKFGEGVRVNAIAPGFFVAEQNRSLLLKADGSLTERGKKIIEHTPMRRFGDPWELCGAVNWLCSDGARFVTGAVIPVDGGFSAFSGV